MTFSLKTKFLFSFLFVLLSVPLTFTLLSNRSYAAGSTTVSLIPNSVNKQVGENIPLDVEVNPGTDEVTILRLQVQYDPTKLEANSTQPFTPSNDFTITSGPNITSGKVSVIVDVEDVNSNVVLSTIKAGTFNFKAIGATGSTPTVVSFTAKTEAYSAGTNDNLRENVLQVKNPANITIGGSAPPTGAGTQLSFVVLLDAIGKAGDTANPTGNSLSNKNPKHPERQLKAEVYNANGGLVSEGTGTIYYQTNNEENKNLNGTFTGSVFLKDYINDGNYTVKIKTDRYLRKAFPGTITLSKNGNNPLSQISLVAGDTNGDNILNIIDYNALLDCGYGALNPLPITNSNAPYNSGACKTHEPRINVDLDDNGIINAFDYNLFIRELQVQTGD